MEIGKWFYRITGRERELEESVEIDLSVKKGELDARVGLANRRLARAQENLGRLPNREQVNIIINDLSYYERVQRDMLWVLALINTGTDPRKALDYIDQRLQEQRGNTPQNIAE